MVFKYDFEAAEQYYKENKSNIEPEWYRETVSEFRQKYRLNGNFEREKQRLKYFLERYAFSSADDYARQNKDIVDLEWYRTTAAEYRQKQANEKRISVKQTISNLFVDYRFDEAKQYSQENKKYVDWEWYKKTETECCLKQKREISNQAKETLRSLLEKYDFSEADNYAQQNKDHFDEEWYEDTKKQYHGRYEIELHLKANNFIQADLLYRKNKYCFDREEFVSKKAEYINKFTFDKFELDYPLDDQQSQSLADIADNMLVTARAGAGKTTVLTCKGMTLAACGYVQDPNAILMLAFNKKAAEEIRERINKKHNMPLFNIRTFHSLAHRIVQPNQREISEDYESEMAGHLRLLLEESPRLKEYLYEFFRKEMNDIENKGLLLNETDYYDYAKYCWESVSLNNKRVKSYGEKCIADFLFEHGLSYVYEESNLFFNNGQKGIYAPDFTIKDSKTKRKMILEHWAIPDKADYRDQRIWNCSDKTERQYAEERNKKREYWKKKKSDKDGYSFVLLETDISWLDVGREQFEKKLKSMLKSNGLECTKLPKEILLENVYKKHSNRLFQLFVSFIQKSRRYGYSPAQIKEKRDYYQTSNPKEQVFLRVAPEIYEKYEKDLDETSRLDFDRLIHLAVEEIHSSNGECCIRDNKNNVNIRIKDIKYILIDEFQDFSKLFYNMISAIREVNPAVKLFCVGDDWQAINGFAGSDLKYFHDYVEDYPNAARRNVLTNYRSGGWIVDAGNCLMDGLGEKSNPTKLKQNKGMVEVVEMDKYVVEGRENQADTNDYQQDQRYLDACEVRMRTKEGEEWKFNDFDTARYLKAIHLILRENLDLLSSPNTNCLILTRTNRFGCFNNSVELKEKLSTVFSTEEIERVGRDRFNEKIQVMTAHKSKGKEADIVFVLKCNLRTFPMNHPDNRLFGIFGDIEKQVFDEEQRLFYVALTRAKQKAYLLTEKENKSCFLRQLSSKSISDSLPF